MISSEVSVSRCDVQADGLTEGEIRIPVHIQNRIASASSTSKTWNPCGNSGRHSKDGRRQTNPSFVHILGRTFFRNTTAEAVDVCVCSQYSVYHQYFADARLVSKTLSQIDRA